MPPSRNPGRSGVRPKRAYRRNYIRRKKVCRFCVEKIHYIDYKDTRLLSASTRNGARSCRGEFPEPARPVNADSWRLSSEPAILLCSPLPQGRLEAWQGFPSSHRLVWAARKETHGSGLERTDREARRPWRGGHGQARLCAQLFAAQAEAVLATPHNLRQVEQEKAAAVRREAIEKNESEMLAQQLAEVSLQFTRKVGEQEVLYGSVTSLDIAESLKEKGFEIDRRKIDLEEHLKSLGRHDVPIKLHQEVTAVVIVEVLREE